MAIALSKEKVQAMHGLMMLYSFLVIFVVNNLVLHLANMLFPAQVVLGTYSISHWWAMYHSMFKLSVIVTFVMPLITYYEWKNNVTFSPKQWMMAYFVVNFASLYEITRFSENLGLGVSSWVVLLLLAFAFNMAQGISMMKLGDVLKHSQK